MELLLLFSWGAAAEIHAQAKQNKRNKERNKTAFPRKGTAGFALLRKSSVLTGFGC